MAELLITLMRPIFIRITEPDEPDPPEQEPTVRVAGLYGRWLDEDLDIFEVTRVIYDGPPMLESRTLRSSDGGVPITPMSVTLNRDAIAATQDLG